MRINFSLKVPSFRRLRQVSAQTWVVLLAFLLAAGATAYFYNDNSIIAYGDSESHLNISKRVIHSLTPGFAQLGGIWLPIPHLFMVPFVAFDSLWRTGLAGSIVSGISFILSALYLYKLAELVTKSRAAAVVASLVFITNPNILYLQSTPMTELPLIAFFVLSNYYFVKYLMDDRNITTLLLAAFWGFCATLTRYDGWALVMMQAGLLGLKYFPFSYFPRRFSEIRKAWDRSKWKKLEGSIILFCTLGLLGILMWMAWDFLILGDPLYFTHSSYSAKSQQQSWLARGELPAYRDIVESVVYYSVTSMSNTGIILFALCVMGLVAYVANSRKLVNYLILLLLLVPFIFNILTLWLGQSVIFIPHITPVDFEWRLFNVRYGVMFVPLAAFAIGYLFMRSGVRARFAISLLLAVQVSLYLVGYSEVVSYKDGVEGLSSASAKVPDAQYWIAREYDEGMVLVDDFARTLSIVRTDIPMQNVIYVGNKPYWEESLVEPEKYATWIIMQENDEVWRSILGRPEIEGRLYTHFQKVYTSPQILIFKRNDAFARD